MMDLHRLLKRLILASIFLLFAVAFFEAVFFDSLPPELQNYRQRMAEDERESLLVWTIGLPLFFIYLLSLFFLWRLKRAGRTLFAAVWIISLFVEPLMMPSVSHPLVELCGMISVLISGLIFGLIYFTDLRFGFEGKQPEEI